MSSRRMDFPPSTRFRFLSMISMPARICEIKLLCESVEKQGGVANMETKKQTRNIHIMSAARASGKHKGAWRAKLQV